MHAQWSKTAVKLHLLPTFIANMAYIRNIFRYRQCLQIGIVSLVLSLIYIRNTRTVGYHIAIKLTSQLNWICQANFSPARSVARWPILLTLNHSDNSLSNHLTIADGRLFGRRPKLAPNGKISGRRPAGVPAEIVGAPSDHLRESRWSLLGENEPRNHRPFTQGCPAVD